MPNFLAIEYGTSLQDVHDVGLLGRRPPVGGCGSSTVGTVVVVAGSCTT